MTTSNNPIRCPKCQGELAEDSNFCPDCGEPIEAVVFADKNLEAAVRVELGIPEGTLTRENLKRLDKLTTNIEGKPSQLEFIVKDLLGLEHAVNLTKVNIIYGQISDLSPLASLINLRSLLIMNHHGVHFDHPVKGGGKVYQWGGAKLYH